jgi:hypothetical protein
MQNANGGMMLASKERQRKRGESKDSERHVNANECLPQPISLNRVCP